MVAVQHNSIGLTNTQYCHDYTRAHAGHVMLQPARASLSVVLQQSKCKDVLFANAKSVHCRTLPGSLFLLNWPERVGFEVFLVARMKMAVFWVATLSSLVEVYQRFRSTCCLIVLMMEAASTSEMRVHFYQGTWCYNPEDSHLHSCQNEFRDTFPNSPVPNKSTISHLVSH
jgi:hypothetical protein